MDFISKLCHGLTLQFIFAATSGAGAPPSLYFDMKRMAGHVKRGEPPGLPRRSIRRRRDSHGEKGVVKFLELEARFKNVWETQPLDIYMVREGTAKNAHFLQNLRNSG
ncbi:MAG: hypothetical protein PHV34_12445 [Verrucomicrobiae bacterium]|nr:hypothetical protein [Verrucomicrobiae bacterium]